MDRSDVSILVGTASPAPTPGCPAFHLYQDCTEQNGDVYLELSTNDPHIPLWFQATPASITIKIPLQVWNNIITIGPRAKLTVE